MKTYSWIDEPIRKFTSSIMKIGYNPRDSADLFYFIQKLNEDMVKAYGELEE